MAKTTAIIRCKILLGGKCSICGYNRCIKSMSMQLHHVDPSKKTVDLSTIPESMPDGDVLHLLESESVMVVCANCHGEIHAGMHPQYLKSLPPRRKTPLRSLISKTAGDTDKKPKKHIPDAARLTTKQLIRARKGNKWNREQWKALNDEFLSRKKLA